MPALLHDLKRRVVLEPDNPEARFELAEALFGDKRFGEAAAQLEKALARTPAHKNARRLLARAYLGEGRTVPAERTLREGIRLFAGLPDMRDALAEVLESIGRVDDALLHLEEAVRLDPDDVRRLALVADLYLRRRLPQRARAPLERAVQLAPDRPDLRERLAAVVLELGGTPDRPESPLDRGRDFLLGRTREALEAEPFSAACGSGPLREVGVCLRQGDLRGAKRILVGADGDAVPKGLLPLLRAEILLAEGEPEKAEAAYRRSLTEAPSVLAWSRLGEVLLHQGAYAPAKEAFEHSLAQGGETIAALVGLGDACRALDREDEARQAYERALTREPGGPAAGRLAALVEATRTREDDARPIGRIGALGWDPTGGIVSPIEAVAVPGRGELIFSGNVGPIGQEAAKVAFTCLKARAAELGIAEHVKHFDLHLHYTDTELAKDGPSAGLALVLAGLSAFTRKPLRPALAATGEVTLHGAVKPVGGLHEKLVAACLAGIRTVLLPRRNLLDARELPPEVTSRVGLVFVDSLVEAVPQAVLTP